MRTGIMGKQNQSVAVNLETGFIVVNRYSTGQGWQEMQNLCREKLYSRKKEQTHAQRVYKGQNEDFKRGKGEVEMWKSRSGLHLVQVHPLVSEPCLSIMSGCVSREKVSDMTCSTQVKSGGKRGSSIKRLMSLYRQITYINQ